MIHTALNSIEYITQAQPKNKIKKKQKNKNE